MKAARKLSAPMGDAVSRVLRSYRASSRLTLAALSSQSGVSPSRLSMIESATEAQTITFGALLAILHVYGTSLARFEEDVVMQMRRNERNRKDRARKEALLSV